MSSSNPRMLSCSKFVSLGMNPITYCLEDTRCGKRARLIMKLPLLSMNIQCRPSWKLPKWRSSAPRFRLWSDESSLCDCVGEIQNRTDQDFPNLSTCDTSGGRQQGQDYWCLKSVESGGAPLLQNVLGIMFADYFVKDICQCTSTNWLEMISIY